MKNTSKNKKNEERSRMLKMLDMEKWKEKNYFIKYIYSMHTKRRHEFRFERTTT